MADIPTEISSINQLTPPQRAQLLRFIEGVTSIEDVKRGLSSFRELNPNLRINSRDLERELMGSFPLTKPATQEIDTPSSTTDVNLGDVGTTAVAGLVAGLTADRSKSSEIIHDLNETKLAFEKDELFTKIQHSLETGDDAAATQLIDSLHSDDILANQVAQLKVRVQEAGGDRNVLDAIDKKHELLQKSIKKDRDENSKTHKPYQEQRSRRAKEIVKALKEINSNNPKFKDVDPAKLLKLRREIFEDFLHSQHIANYSRLYDILTPDRKFVGKLFGLRKPILTKGIRKNLLKRGEDEKKEREQRKNPQNAEEETALESIVSEQPRQPNIIHAPSDSSSPAPINPSPNPSPASSPSAPAGLPSVPSGVKNKAVMTLLSQPWFWAIIIALVFFVIIVVIIMGNQSGPVPLTQLSCGNAPTVDELKTPQLIADRLRREFHIGLAGTILSTDIHNPTSISIVKNAYDTVCILFGQHTGSIDIQKSYNTFGTHLVGNYGTDDTRPLAKHIVITIYSSPNPVKDHTDCSITPYGNPEKDPEIIWYFWRPEKCFSNYEFQFKIAQALGHSLIYQEEALVQGKTSDPKSYFFTNVFPDFSPITIQYGKPNPLPTDQCTSAIGKQNFLPNCFADMVGEYITYPYYLDKIATSAATLQGFSDFKTSPNYQPYYEFAYNELFDKNDVFENPSVFQCPSPPKDTVAGIQQDLKTIYGVTLMGDVGKDKSDALLKAKNTWNTVCMMALSNKIKTTLFDPRVSDPIAIYWDDKSACADDSSYHKGSSTNICAKNGINEDCVRSGAYCTGTVGDALNRMNVGHELGHIFSWREPEIFKQFCQQVYGGQMGAGGDSWECVTQSDFKQTAIPKTIPTYSCLYDYTRLYCDSQGVPCWGSVDKKGNPVPSKECPTKCTGPFGSECFADMVGEYVSYDQVRSLPFNPKSGTTMDGHVLNNDFKEYPTRYSNYYNFASQNIYEGLKYGIVTDVTSIGGYALKLVYTYKDTASCSHDAAGRGWAYLDHADLPCISQPKPSLGTFAQGAIDALLASIDPKQDGYFAVQCVAFVRAVVAGIGNPFTVHYANAKDYIKGVPGYTVIKRTDSTIPIQVGDIVVYNTNHIAVVSEVNGKSTAGGRSPLFYQFKVAEGNGGYCKSPDGKRTGGCLDNEPQTTLNTDISGWLRKQ